MVSRHKCRDFSFHRANYRSRDNRWDITCPLEESEQRQVSMTAASGRNLPVSFPYFKLIKRPQLVRADDQNRVLNNRPVNGWIVVQPRFGGHL